MLLQSGQKRLLLAGGLLTRRWQEVCSAYVLCIAAVQLCSYTFVRQEHLIASCHALLTSAWSGLLIKVWHVGASARS